MAIVIFNENGAENRPYKGRPTMEELCEWVGVKPGYLQLVMLGSLSDGAQMWVDEEGKLRGKSLNVLATMLYQKIARTHDVIVGTAVVLTEEHRMD